MNAMKTAMALVMGVGLLNGCDQSKEEPDKTKVELAKVTAERDLMKSQIDKASQDAKDAQTKLTDSGKQAEGSRGKPSPPASPLPPSRRRLIRKPPAKHAAKAAPKVARSPRRANPVAQAGSTANLVKARAWQTPPPVCKLRLKRDAFGVPSPRPRSTNMKKFGLLMGAALFALGCGGLDGVLGPADAGVCVGVTPFQISDEPDGNENYTALSGSTSTRDDGLHERRSRGGPDLTRHGCPRRRKQCRQHLCITAVGTAADQTVNLGCGDIRCNTGTLTNSYAFTDTTKCNWTNTNTVDVTVTAPKQMKICLKQVRSNHTSISAGSCTQVKDCTVSWCQTIAAP